MSKIHKIEIRVTRQTRDLFYERFYEFKKEHKDATLEDFLLYLLSYKIGSY